MSLDDQELSARIRQHATRHVAPDGLRAGIRAQVALAEAGRAAAAPSASARRRWFDLPWRTATVSFALGLACALLAVPAVQRLMVVQPLDAELVAMHVRALQVGPLAEVVSTDRHTVKPWFQGRLDYAPPVVDLATEGFALTGGRVEHVRGDVVATLAYAQNRHVIDLALWPSAARTPPAHSVRRGFNVLQWADGSMQYWAVSDLERGELEHFARLWIERTAAP